MKKDCFVRVHSELKGFVSLLSHTAASPHTIPMSHEAQNLRSLLRHSGLFGNLQNELFASRIRMRVYSTICLYKKVNVSTLWLFTTPRDTELALVKLAYF